MPNIFAIIFPIFAVVGIGYLAAYRGLLQPQDNAGIAKFVFTLAIPMLLFDSLSSLAFPEPFQWQFLLSFYISALGIYALAVFVSKVGFKAALKEQAIFGLGASYSNTVLVGLPVVVATFGESGLLPMSIIISLHSLILFAVFMIMAEAGQEGSTWLRRLTQSLRNLLENPLIIGLLAGLLARLLSLQLPEPVNEVVRIIGRAALPCALIVLGASLREYSIRGDLTKAWVMTALKLVAQPLIAWLLVFYIFKVDHLWAVIAVLAAAMPVGVNAYIMANKYQVGRATISTSILLSTFLSMFTLFFLLLMLL